MTGHSFPHQHWRQECNCESVPESSNSLASFPGSSAPGREHWNCSDGESLGTRLAILRPLCLFCWRLREPNSVCAHADKVTWYTHTTYTGCAAQGNNVWCWPIDWNCSDGHYSRGGRVSLWRRWGSVTILRSPIPISQSLLYHIPVPRTIASGSHLYAACSSICDQDQKRSPVSTS